MTFKIAIIGAGIGGPALALQLQSIPSVEPTIYEQRPGGFEEGQHISLAPNAMRVLDHIGVANKLATIGNTYEELHLRNARAAHIATFHNGSEQQYGFGAMRIHRQHVQRILVEECMAKGVRICHGMKLKAIKEPGGGHGRVQLLFDNDKKVEADLVVGSDGLHSAVRGYICPESDSRYENMLGITGYLKRRDLHASANAINLPSHFIGANGFIAVMPSDVSGDEVGFFSTMEFAQHRTRAEWKQLYHDKDAIRKLLKDRFSAQQGWCDLVTGVCDGTKANSLCSWPFFVAPPLPTWRSESGRVLVMGDAAHALIPTGGLGASLALEDAECLSHVVRTASKQSFKGNGLKNGLQLWESHRRERLALVQEFTNRNRRLRAPGGTWLAQYLKEWFMWAFFMAVGSGGVAAPIYSYDTGEFAKRLSLLDA